MDADGPVVCCRLGCWRSVELPGAGGDRRSKGVWPSGKRGRASRCRITVVLGLREDGASGRAPEQPACPRHLEPASTPSPPPSPPSPMPPTRVFYRLRPHSTPRGPLRAHCTTTPFAGLLLPPGTLLLDEHKNVGPLGPPSTPLGPGDYPDVPFPEANGLSPGVPGLPLTP